MGTLLSGPALSDSLSYAGYLMSEYGLAIEIAVVPLQKQAAWGYADVIVRARRIPAQHWPLSDWEPLVVGAHWPSQHAKTFEGLVYKLMLGLHNQLEQHAWKQVSMLPPE